MIEEVQYTQSPFHPSIESVPYNMYSCDYQAAFHSWICVYLFSEY